MVRESSGILVQGDQSILTYVKPRCRKFIMPLLLRHICSQQPQVRPTIWT